MQNIRKQLQSAEDRLRRLREDRARLNKVFKAAKTAAEANETDETLGAAFAAKDAVGEVQQQIEVAGEEQTELLRRFGAWRPASTGRCFPAATDGSPRRGDWTCRRASFTSTSRVGR